MEDYVILSGSSRGQLQQEVKSFMNSRCGYVLVGGVTATGEMFYQAVAKYRN